MRLAAPVVSMAPTSAGTGYWLIARDGGVFSFKTSFYGSLPGRGVRKPAVRLRTTPTGKGYWMLGADGTVRAFGDAVNKGSITTTGAVDLARV
jgi:hypothetical protein